jgi:hypothetical protein
VKILYRNPRRPGEAGMKLVPDQSQRAAEKEILEGLGFIVIEITPAPFARRYTRVVPCQEQRRLSVRILIV